MKNVLLFATIVLLSFTLTAQTTIITYGNTWTTVVTRVQHGEQLLLTMFHGPVVLHN